MDSASQIISKAIERHGGMEAFRSIDTIRVRICKMAGPVPRLKGAMRLLARPVEVSVRVHHQQATFHGLGENGVDVAFDNGTMTVGDRESVGYRDTFRGLAKLRRWNVMDVGYFFGYALCNYFSLPFQLPNFELLEHGQTGKGLSWVRVRFPDGFDTHCRVQRFWFDESGLLIRHDYCADIIGPVFTGAHFSRDYCTEFAIPIARRRLVKARLGTTVTPFPALDAELEVVEVQ